MSEGNTEMATSPHVATPEPLMDRSKIEADALCNRFKETKQKNTALEVLEAPNLPLKSV